MRSLKPRAQQDVKFVVLFLAPFCLHFYSSLLTEIGIMQAFSKASDHKAHEILAVWIQEGMAVRP